MIVAQLRGIEFVKRKGGYWFPENPCHRIAHYVLDEVAMLFGFDESNKYLTGLKRHGKKLLAKIKK